MTGNPNWPTPIPDALGPLVGADDVRDALKATIDLWSAYYLNVVSQRLFVANRIGGTNQPPNPLPNFGTWVNEPSFRSIGSGQPAACLVTCPGTVGTPDAQGTGKVRASWRGIAVVQVFGTDWQEAADLTNWYEKCIRWCVLQHRSLGGFAAATKWTGSAYSAIEHSSTRTEGRVQVGFDVDVPNVIDMTRGPATPTPPGPPPADPTVEFTILEMTKYPDDDPLPSP